MTACPLVLHHIAGQKTGIRQHESPAHSEKLLDLVCVLPKLNHANSLLIRAVDSCGKCIWHACPRRETPSRPRVHHEAR